ncbi:MAG: extracellular solute-binding protein, partial [Bdellovibrionales bacterium]|nr:extracellular solute-binding protein [Bdellovibrionales bacterium]
MKNIVVVSLLSLAASVGHADLLVNTDRPLVRFQQAAKIIEAATGQKVVFVEEGTAQLIKKLEAPQAGASADLIMVKDVVFLGELKAKNLLQPIGQVPAAKGLHASMVDSHFLPLTVRTRTLVYDSTRVKPEEVATYEDLAKPEWAGRLCLRTSQGTYNQTLVAGMILTYGEKKTREILKGWLNNLATKVFSNDTAMLQAMANGVCDVGISNHYYLAGLVQQNPQFPVKIKYLNQKAGGVLTNGSAIGVVAASTQAELARKFIEILLSPAVQLEISGAHLDYPAVTGLSPSISV